MSTETPRLHMPRSSGGRDLDQRGVERQLAGGEQARDVGEEDRRVVAEPLLDDVADVLGDEEAVDAEVLRRARVSA